MPSLKIVRFFVGVYSVALMQHYCDHTPNDVEGHAEPRPYRSLTLYSEIETFWIEIIHRQNITTNWDQTGTNLKMLYPQNALVLVLVLVHL